MLDATLQPEGVDEVSVEIDEIETEDNLQNQEYETIASANTALESYIDILKTSDGLTRQSAAILNVGLNNCFKTLGLKQQSTGLEDYVSCNSLDARTQATVSVESLLEKAKAGIKKAIEWIIERLKKLKAWYDNFGRKAKTTSDRVDGIQEELKGKDINPDIEFEITGELSFRLKPSVSNGKFVNEATTEPYKRMVKLNQEYPRLTREAILSLDEVVERRALDERSEIMVDLLEDLQLENNFSFGNARLEDGKIIADFENVTAWEGEPIQLKTRDFSSIDNDIKACKVIVGQIETLAKFLDKISDDFLKHVNNIEHNLDDEQITEIIKNNKMIIENIVNAPALRSMYLSYLNFVNHKLTAIDKEIKAAETEPDTEK